MQYLSIRNIFYLLIIVLTMAVLIFSYKYYIKQQNALNLYGLKHLPKKIRMIIRLKRIKHLSLIVIKQGKASYYSNFSDPHWTNKLTMVQNTITRIMHSNNTIPDGYYLLSMEDGVHKQYPMPLLGFASDANLVANNKVVLIPDFEAHHGYIELFKRINYAVNKYPWSKKKSHIFWRGSATGVDFSRDKFNYPRLQFMHFANDNHHYINAGFTSYATGKTGKNKKLYLYLSKNFSLVDIISSENSLVYKYLLDIDGHSCSYSRMAWILNSNSLLLKHNSNKVQWYYNRLQPYVHYIPIKKDFSDLQTQYNWMEANQDKVQIIIKNAQKLAADIFNQDAIDLATRTAFLNYYELTQNITKLK